MGVRHTNSTKSQAYFPNQGLDKKIPVSLNNKKTLDIANYWGITSIIRKMKGCTQLIAF